MNRFTVASTVLGVLGLICIGVAIVAHDAWLTPAMILAVLAAYTDHLATEKDVRDFMNRERP